MKKCSRNRQSDTSQKTPAHSHLQRTRCTLLTYETPTAGRSAHSVMFASKLMCRSYAHTLCMLSIDEHSPFVCLPCISTKRSSAVFCARVSDALRLQEPQHSHLLHTTEQWTTPSKILTTQPTPTQSNLCPEPFNSSGIPTDCTNLTDI